MSRKKVIIFGSTGAIGTSLAEYLSNNHASWEIQAASRSPPSESSKNRLAQLNLPNVTMVQGDPEKKEEVLRLCQGCDIIYCCVGFHRYEAKYWGQHWPVVVDNLLSAIVSDKEKKTKLVFCDNIYAYGPGENISIHSERVPTSKSSKPGIRAMLHETFSNHMKEHPGTLTIIGAADFFGPHVTATSFLGDTCTGKIVVDEASPLAIGSCDKIHDFCYTPDFAKAMAVASVDDKAYNNFWIAPHSIHGKSLQDIGNMIADKAGRPSPVKFTVIKPFLVYMLSPFMTFMREMIEMLPFWKNDYSVDDTDFIKAFGMEATPMDQALQAYVGFFQTKKTETASK